RSEDLKPLRGSNHLSTQFGHSSSRLSCERRSQCCVDCIQRCEGVPMTRSIANSEWWRDRLPEIRRSLFHEDRPARQDGPTSREPSASAIGSTNSTFPVR